MRLLILSTPKTGSTWLRNLLSCIYGVPQVDLDYPFNPETASRTGSGWVSHHHFLPAPDLLEWIRANDVRVITMIRHPADVLVSLYHHLHGFSAKPIDQTVLRAMLRADFDRSPILPAQPGRPFDWELSISLAWRDTDAVTVVRYEDLWRQPADALTRLTAALAAIDGDRIEMAIEQCSLPLLRSLAGPHGAFFRSGLVGDWRHALAPEVVRDLGSLDPYPTLFDRLGYTLDPADPLVDAPPQPRQSMNPFRDVPSFENGVPVPPIAVHAFLAQPPDQRRRWLPVDRTGPGSFFAWLSEPGMSRPCDPSWMLPLTNLALYVYRQRLDLRTAFDLDGIGRPLFAEWCLAYLEPEYGVHEVFRAPISDALQAWGNGPSPEDLPRDGELPLTNYAVFLYRTRTDLQAAFSDVVRTHRLSFLHWIVTHAGTLTAPAACIATIRHLLIASAAPICATAPGTARHNPAGSRLPRFAINLYDARTELQAAFPDVRDTHQLSFLDWIITHFHTLDERADRFDEARRFLLGRLQEIAEG